MPHRTFSNVGYIGEGPYGWKSLGYQRWWAMLARCYAPTSPAIARRYAGCKVDPVWHDFQNYAAWFEAQGHATDASFQVDKDLKIFGNKTYAPERCILIPAKLNNALKALNQGGQFGPGVKQHTSGRFEARINKGGSGYRYLGVFDTATEASQAWQVEHVTHLIELGLNLLEQDAITHTTMALIYAHTESLSV